MRSTIVLCGIVMLSTTATPNNLKNTNVKQDRLLPSIGITASRVSDSCVTCRDIKVVDLADIRFIEEEDTVDLGFDTADYLPAGFDPYEAYVDLGTIMYIEENGNEELGFETAAWLPEGFDPYAAPADFASISYLEPDCELYPEIETRAWLPEGFDAYAAYAAPVVICNELVRENSR